MNSKLYKVDFDINLKNNPYGGLYIALEGIDGSGKTTQVERLADVLRKRGKEVVLTREPRKNGLIGDLIQKVLLGKEKIPSVALQYLFSADRSAHHKELIEPSLKEGKVVISDRCFWSAIVYGILDRNEGKYDKNDANLLLISQSILSFYHQFIVPDYTFYLKIPLNTSMHRIDSKTEAREIYEEEGKIAKVLKGYEYLKSRFADEIIEINGEQSISKVTGEMLSKINRI